MDLPMQRKACHKFAEAKGWVIVHEEQEEGVSGHKVRAEARDKLQIIKEYARKGKFDILLVFMFDRIGRIADETPFVVEWFVRNGIRVWSTQEGDPRNSEGAYSLDLALGNCKVPLQLGSQESDCVRLIQQKLKRLGYYLFDNQEGLYEINGVYDENTANAVMRLQSDYKDKYHLNVSGVFDSETKDCLINI